eukprot:TRINITY_DN111767_c0_g1_i1.p1 TRINITY_DN111767_c0_g1~~TRINITY_DN111767_c0_g1_i1.p1  ORF type:complete len:631 (+),score=21.92 TRINITY_DN111767_c0_g1_i1:59-1951(+)
MMHVTYPRKLRGDWDNGSPYPLRLQGDWDLQLSHACQGQATVGKSTCHVESENSMDARTLQNAASSMECTATKVSTPCAEAARPARRSSASRSWARRSWAALQKSPGKLSSSPSMRTSDIKITCTTSIPETLLRAVDIQEVLLDFGRHWKSNAGRDEDFERSRIVQDISVFVSHDWGTSRVIKVAAFLFYSNMPAACSLSCLSCVVVPLVLRVLGQGFSESADVIYQTVCGDVPSPRQVALVSTATGFGLFLWIFFFWQRMRSRIFSPSTVFLDKLCIHQTDSDKKAVGILGLAAFLKASETLLVLWSERYFTRLWCTYELAAWCKLGKDFATGVCFVPAAATLRVVLLVCSCAATLLFYELSVITLSVDHQSVWAAYLLFGIMYCGTAMHTYRALFSSLNLLSMQLQTYRVDDADCFCCSCGHRDPLSGASIQCDRELVMRTLRTWRIEETNQCEDTAEHYNAFVTKELRTCVDVMFESASSMKHAFLLTLPIMWGNLARVSAELLWVAIGDNPDRFGLCGALRFALVWVLDLLQLALGWKLLFLIAWRTSITDTDSGPHVKTSFLLGLVVIAVLLAARSIALTVVLFGAPSVLAAYSGGVVLLVSLVYWRRSPWKSPASRRPFNMTGV